MKVKIRNKRLIAGFIIFAMIAAAIGILITGYSLFRWPEYDGRGYYLPLDDPQIIMIYKYVVPSLYDEKRVQWKESERDENEVDDVKKRIEGYTKLDGYKMSFGRNFDTESTLLIELYSELISRLDDEKRCDEAAHYVDEIRRLYNDKQLLFIYSPLFIGGLVFIYPDMDVYGKEPDYYEKYLQVIADPFHEDGRENCKDVEKQLDMIVYGRVVDENEIDAGDWEKEPDGMEKERRKK